jgi:GAF domain-containing protein
VSVDDTRAAVAAGLVGAEEAHTELLQSIVEVARAIFGARASSITLLDEETDELVFRAVAGEGSDRLVGQRFPASAGIAGWVLVSREPVVIEDVSKHERFADDVAAATGFVPQGLMAVPLVREERALGVLEVLDRPQRSVFSLAEMELLGLFANQAAAALDLVERAGRAKRMLERGSGEAAAVARLAAALDALEGDRAEQARALLDALAKLLGADQRRHGE